LTTLFIPSFRSTVFFARHILSFLVLLHGHGILCGAAATFLSHIPQRQLDKSVSRVARFPQNKSPSQPHQMPPRRSRPSCALVSRGTIRFSSRDRQQQFACGFSTSVVFSVLPLLLCLGGRSRRYPENLSAFELILTQPSDIDPGKMGGG